MPRPKRKYTSQTSITKRDDSINSTSMDMDSKIMNNSNFKQKMWRAEVKDKMKNDLKKLSDLQKQKLNEFEQEFQRLLMTLPKNVLNATINIVSLQISHAYFLSLYC